MAWTTPKTDWNTGELVAPADMNAIGENLLALKNQKATAIYTTTENILAASSSRSFVDVDSTNLKLTITTSGGDVMVHLHCSGHRHDSGNRVHMLFDIDVDGNRQGGDNGLARMSLDQAYSQNLSFTYIVQNLDPGSHTFKLQWKGGGTGRMQAGAQFWVREI